VTESSATLPPALLVKKPRVDQYIHRGNIAVYRRRLLETSDTAARKVLFRLLAEEEAKGEALRSGRPRTRSFDYEVFRFTFKEGLSSGGPLDLSGRSHPKPLT
jgi:hypothetical protein